MPKLKLHRDKSRKAQRLLTVSSKLHKLLDIATRRQGSR